MALAAALVKRVGARQGIAVMNAGDGNKAGDMKATREERLAAKLRENLRRRKAQARDKDAAPPGGDGVPLSKQPPKS